MKKLVSCIIIICFLLMSFGTVSFAATFQPTISASNGKVGDTITVTVSIPANTNAAGGSFNLIYDNTKMELVDATAGDIISAFSKTVNKTYAANKVRVNFAGSETVSASGGVVLNATFRLTASGTATFSTEKFKLADIDTNYLTCENSTQNISITSGGTSSAFTPTIAAENGAVGDTVNVTVSIPANTNAAGGSFNLIYDNTKMELVDATAGDIISAFSKTVNKTYAENKVRLNFAGSEIVSASGGVVLNASFKLIAAGTATFSTEKFKLADIDTNYLTCENTSKTITITAPSTTVAVTGVSLNKTSTTLTVGETETLTATVVPTNATNKNVSWTSSNTSVASVSNGVITAKAAGTATITVKTADGSKTATCTVTVNAPVVENAPNVKIVSATGKAGKTVDVVIEISNNPGIAYLSFNLGYDRSKMTLQSVTGNDIFANADFIAGNLEKNPYTVLAANYTGDKTGNGKFATAIFLIKDDCAEGTYEITVTEPQAYNIDETEKTFTTTNGVVTVKNVDAGDVTGDGKINGMDLLRLGKHFAGWTVDIDETGADVTGDGKINGMDLLRLGKYFAGWEVKLGK